MDPAIEHGLLRRRSGRLRKRQRLNDDDDDDGEKGPKQLLPAFYRTVGFYPANDI